MEKTGNDEEKRKEGGSENDASQTRPSQHALGHGASLFCSIKWS